jgi:integrase
MFRGRRSTTCVRLGFFPAMSTAKARQAAQIEAGRVAAGKITPGKHEAVTLETALANYSEHLKAQAAKRGKKATWAALAGSLTRKHLLPVLGHYTLAELSNLPALVRDWHADVSKIAPVSANRCASILSATYRYAARLDRSLPPANPCSAVRQNTEHAAQTGLPFDQFPEWEHAVAALPPLHAAFYRFCLLTGMRSGEAGRLRWSDVNCRARTVTIHNSKSGAGIVVPMSWPIASALRMAREVGREGQELIFPNARKWSDDIPAKGHTLRHSWRSVAADLGVNEILARLLLGHSLTGVNQSYITAHLLSGGPGLRGAQATISKRIVALLKPM